MSPMVKQKLPTAAKIQAKLKPTRTEEWNRPLAYSAEAQTVPTRAVTCTYDSGSQGSHGDSEQGEY